MWNSEDKEGIISERTVLCFVRHSSHDDVVQVCFRLPVSDERYLQAGLDQCSKGTKVDIWQGFSAILGGNVRSFCGPDVTSLSSSVQKVTLFSSRCFPG